MSELNWKHTGRFVAAAFLMDFSAGMFGVALPYLAMALGAGSFELGLLGAARAVTYMIACPTVALLARGWSRRLPVAFGALGVAAVVALPAVAASPWHLYGLIALWAAALSFFWPSLFAWLGDSHSPAQLGRATAAVNIGWSVGALVSGAVAGLLFTVARPLPFMAAALPALLACIALGVRSPAAQVGPAVVARPRARPGNRRRLVAGWLGSVGACCLVGLISTVFPRLGVDIGVTPVVFGVFMAALGVGRTLAFMAGLRGSSLVGNLHVSALLQLGAAGLVATVGFASSHLWLGLVFCCVGACIGMSYYLALYRSLEGGGARGVKSSLHEAVLLGGILVGALGGGWLADTVGLRAPYPIIAGAVALLTIVQVALEASARSARADRRIDTPRGNV